MQNITHGSCLETVADTEGGTATDLVSVTAPLACDVECVTSPLDWGRDRGTAPLCWDVHGTTADGVTDHLSVPLDSQVASVSVPLVWLLITAGCDTIVLSVCADIVTSHRPLADTLVSDWLRNGVGNVSPQSVALRASTGRLPVGCL